LHRYEAAYDKLDAAAAKRIWPGVNERALARAFSGLSSQRLRLDPCSVEVTGDNAIASCRGLARYVGRVGGKAAQVQERTWTLQLRRIANDNWQIGSVDIN
jgi:hypothetical protein